MTGEIETGTMSEGRHGRRVVLKRAALIGGATVWATPVVQTMAAPALATGGSDAGTTPGGATALTMDVYVSNPLDPSMPPLRLCKTIEAKGATEPERVANCTELKAVYCPTGNIIEAVLHAVANPARFDYPRSCTAADVPTTC